MAKESTVENKFNKRQKSRGWMVRKYVTPGRKGAFDRIYHKMGVTAYIEWKHPEGTGEVSKHQEETQQELHEHGIPAAVFDSYEEAGVWMDALEECMQTHGWITEDLLGDPVY